jgi:phosphoribosyl 1,2-cyclic phosphodiesterase
MLIRFWGTRGSIPAPGFETARYGGNTTCFEVIGDDDYRIIVDAGTGIRRLGRSLNHDDAKELQTHLLLTHFHWDHIQGIPFFDLLTTRGAAVQIRVPADQTQHSERILQTLLDPLFFPVSRRDVSARVTSEAAAATESIGDTQVQTGRVDHPGGAIAYRLNAGGDAQRSVVLAPDSEVTAGAGANRTELENLAWRARVLVHDAMYTESEYAARRRWGHSSHLAAVDLAMRCETRLLVLFHHHPDRADGQVEMLLEECKEAATARGSALQIVAAHEGLEIEV